jgi:hypothetical protein
MKLKEILSPSFNSIRRQPATPDQKQRKIDLVDYLFENQQTKTQF